MPLDEKPQLVGLEAINGYQKIKDPQTLNKRDGVQDYYAKRDLDDPIQSVPVKTSMHIRSSGTRGSAL